MNTGIYIFSYLCNMKKICLIVLSFFALTIQAQNLPTVKIINWKQAKRVSYASVGQFQIKISYKTDPASAIPYLDHQDEHIKKVERCLEIAKANKLNIIIFPELTLSMNDSNRTKLISIFKDYSKANDAIIIGGTYYTPKHRCVCANIMPSGVFNSYKMRPSVFESSVYKGRGMINTDTMVVFRTKYGNYIPLVCVDLISDDANYMARFLSNKDNIDMIHVIEYNSSTMEFIRELSSLVLRHPSFGTLTNISSSKGGSDDSSENYQFGNSALLGSLMYSQRKNIMPDIPQPFKDSKGYLQECYGSLISVLNPNEEAALLYDLNLNMKRVPKVTNAPDQGYPTVHNIQKITIE
jgi:predicted amidohydrolase